MPAPTPSRPPTRATSTNGRCGPRARISRAGNCGARPRDLPEAMTCHVGNRIWRGIALLLFGVFATFPVMGASSGDAQLREVAQEARQVIAVINWFYLRHRACPLP